MSKRTIRARRVILAAAIGAVITALSPATFAQVNTPAMADNKHYALHTLFNFRNGNDIDGASSHRLNLSHTWCAR